MEIRPFKYNGGPVSDELLFEAFEFMISLEPDPDAEDYMGEFRANAEKYSDSLKMAEAAVRRFGEDIHPNSLEMMQGEYYRILELASYSFDSIGQSVVSSTLNRGWNGIGDWQS